MSVAEWVKSGKHLPKFLRDFHDQKDVFKVIARLCPADDKDPYYVSWVNAQCYTIDKFLRVMAFCGWTLQRTRHAEEFCDIDAEIKQMKDESADVLVKFLSDRRAPPPA